MPRKTNKTAHVLNLLASGTSKENEPDELDSSALSPNISIIDNPTNPADPLAGLIRNSLNKEILQGDETEGSDTPSASDTPGEPSVEVASEPAPDSVSEKESATAAKTGKKSAAKASSATKTASKSKTSAKSKTELAVESILDSEPTLELNSTSEEVPASEPEPEQPVSAPLEAAPEPIPAALVITSAPTPSEPIAEPEADYVYINMMEILLEERLLEFMNRFDACTCDRCMKDARALALSNLPPKYIVVPKASVAPLTSFYRNKYSIYIVTELTKASLAVINNPRH